MTTMAAMVHAWPSDHDVKGDEVEPMDYTDRLQRLAIHDASVTDERSDAMGGHSGRLSVKEVALVRLAALVAVGAAVPSYGAHADAALSAGATVDEIVDVLFGVLTVVGLPCAVAAAPRLAMALGYDISGTRPA